MLFTATILLSIMLCGCTDDDDCGMENAYDEGLIMVEFIDGVNETQAYEIINQYNLTIGGLLFEDDYVIKCEVEVSRGNEKYYADLLGQDPFIKDAYRGGGY